MAEVETDVSGARARAAAAAELFGDRIDLARAFTSALAEQGGEERGLIGPLEVPRLWTRHILNSAIAAPLFHGGDVADVGSGGAGLLESSSRSHSRT